MFCYKGRGGREGGVGGLRVTSCMFVWGVDELILGLPLLCVCGGGGLSLCVTLVPLSGSSLVSVWEPDHGTAAIFLSSECGC